MTPQDFIRKWKPVALTERATAQEHFIDLCRLFDHPTPAEDDPKGDRFAFEKGASRIGGGDGWADSIECRDALLAPDGKGGFKEAEWPEADFIVGNPPFLGGKLMRSGLGDATVETPFRIYADRVPAEADIVCYWFAKAWQALERDAFG